MSTPAIRRRAVACPAALTILLTLGVAPAPAAARCAGATARPAALGGGARQAAIVCELNRVRRHHGLAPVSAHGRLNRIGEILAWGEGRLSTPRAAVRSWLHSPPHRRVLLGRNYRDIGVGVAIGSPYGGGRGSATYVANLGAG